MTSLRDFYLQHRAQATPLVLATVVSTSGSTYRKSGAQMLIAGDGQSAGLLSGGCLESDLAERAQAVLRSGLASLVEYDTRTSDDLIWGLGLGCEGAMRILLQPLHAGQHYQPFDYIQQCRDAQRAGCYALAIESHAAAWPLGHAIWDDTDPALPAPLQAELRAGLASAVKPGKHTSRTLQLEAASFLIAPVPISPRLLILGAGPDVLPLVTFAAQLSWHVTVVDHRPAYAVPTRLPLAQRVVLNPAAALAATVDLGSVDAAIVMSHHLASDLAYLQQLAQAPPRYIGLLGPMARRARLLAELGPTAQQFGPRLHGPAGLDIGASTPETIALAIVSQIQAVLSGHAGGEFAR